MSFHDCFDEYLVLFPYTAAEILNKENMANTSAAGVKVTDPRLARETRIAMDGNHEKGVRAIKAKKSLLKTLF